MLQLVINNQFSQKSIAQQEAEEGKEVAKEKKLQKL